MAMTRVLPVLILGMLLGAVTTAAQAQALSPQDKTRMMQSDIVLMGEHHDNARHHLLQADLIRDLAPKAVVFEMLSPEQAAIVNADPRLDLADLGAKIGWEAAGWGDFALYAPVFAALEQTPVAGAAQPRAQIRRAFSEGAAAVFAGDAGLFGLNRPLPAAQLSARMDMQFAAHCTAMPLEMMGGMVEAQRLRDAQFSATTLAALARHGSPVVVITGHGHARKDWGMPAMLALAAPDTSVFALGLLEEPADPSDPRFDAAIVTEPAPRGDPCAAFEK